MEFRDSFLTLFDSLLPGRHWLAVVLVAAISLIAAALLWLSGLLFQWRKDQRETRESTAVLMGHLVEQQRSELNQRLSEGDALRRQMDLFIAGRWELQRALDDMREQMIAARIMIHDYERRLGLPETPFPPMPSLAVIPKAA